VTGVVHDPGSYREAMEAATRVVDIAQFRARQQAARAEGRWLGLGISVFAERTCPGTPAFAARRMVITPGFERVELIMDPSGFIEARVGSSPHGQGLKTTLAQLIADETGIAPDQIRVVAGDTDRSPYGWGTFASRSLVIAGGACKLAAATLRDRLHAFAGQMLEADASDIELSDGRAFVRGTDLGVEVQQLARAAYHQSHRFPVIAETGLSAVATYDPYGTFSNACHVAIVEVDLAIGQVAIERFVVVEDASRLINPMIVEGQIHGGVAQGIANALYEKMIYDDRGNLLTGSLTDYPVPTTAEIPSIEIHHLETLTEASVTGAKGVGEGGTIGAPAAILYAGRDPASDRNRAAADAARARLGPHPERADGRADQRSRAALLDRRHDLELSEAHMSGIGSAPVGSMAMKDVCDLQPGAAHRRPARPRVAASSRSMVPAGRVGWSRPGSWYWRRGCKALSCRAWRGPRAFESREYRHLARGGGWRNCAAACVATRAS